MASRLVRRRRRQFVLIAMLGALKSYQAFRCASRKFWRPKLSRQTLQRRHLNRFLFDAEDIITDEGGDGAAGDDDNHNNRYVMLPKDDYRAIHAAKTLGLQNGDKVRAGIVLNHGPHPWPETTRNIELAGFLTDKASVAWIPEGKVKKAEPLRNGNPPGSLKIVLQGLKPSPALSAEEPGVALILCLPRPLQLGRMLPMIAQMGVSELILSQARKVPKDYFGSHLFRKPEAMRERLVEGLCQAGDVRLPSVRVAKNLKQFLEEDLDEAFPSTEYARVIAHPRRAKENSVGAKRMRDVVFPSRRRRLLMAVGPEGGWEEPEELDRMIDQHGFQHVTMGTRVLRSDCAVVSLLALAHDAVEEDDNDLN